MHRNGCRWAEIRVRNGWNGEVVPVRSEGPVMAAGGLDPPRRRPLVCSMARLAPAPTTAPAIRLSDPSQWGIAERRRRRGFWYSSPPARLTPCPPGDSITGKRMTVAATPGP
jgi:hypothetical protein